MTHYPAHYRGEAFHCPTCNVYAKQEWHSLIYVRYTSQHGTEMSAARCAHCDRLSYWHDEQLAVPAASPVELPSADLPESCTPDYLEAREIVAISPRGSAALLRLCIQKLLAELGKSGKNINDDIAQLVKEGLPPLIQQSLDICRVVGNNAVHPGEINLQDSPEVAHSLFKLINLIVQDRITRPNEVKALYEALPAGALQAIAKRDDA